MPDSSAGTLIDLTCLAVFSSIREPPGHGFRHLVRNHGRHRPALGCSPDPEEQPAARRAPTHRERRGARRRETRSQRDETTYETRRGMEEGWELKGWSKDDVGWEGKYNILSIDT